LENGLFDFTTNLSVKKENRTIKSNSKYNLLVKSQTALMLLGIVVAGDCCT
jgi:hypothetical protein